MRDAPTDRDAEGRCTIHLRAYFEGQRLRLVTREKCLASEWQTDKQRFRRSKQGYQDANDYLESLAARVQAAYDMAMHDRLLGFLRHEKKLAQNSIWKVVKHIKAMLAYLNKDRGLPLAVEPKQLKAEWVDVDKVYLTAAELAILEAARLPVGLVRTRDAFLFCCYTGLRYSDLAELREGNLHDWRGARVLRLTQTKTRTSVSIYLTGAAAALLEKYRGEGLRLMPVMANQVMNRNLKEITKRAGLRELVEVVTTETGKVVKQQVPKHELVTMHTARHTFATQGLLRGMLVEVLQKVMDHARLQTTLIYAKIVEDFQHQTMRRVWDGEPVAAEPATADVCRVMVAA